MTLAFAIQCSPGYASHLRVLLDSLHRFHSDALITVYAYDGFRPTDVTVIDAGNTNNNPWDRPWVIADALDRHEKVCFLGADTELFAPLDEAEKLLCDHEFVICPHLIDNKTNVQADFQLWRQPRDGKSLLSWYAAHVREFANEQICLAALVQRFGCHVWLTKTHNVAYWNAQEYGLNQREGIWRTSDGPLVLAHYSGFEPTKPWRMSRHYHGPDASGDVRRFYERYAALLGTQPRQESRQRYTKP